MDVCQAGHATASGTWNMSSRPRLAACSTVGRFPCCSQEQLAWLPRFVPPDGQYVAPAAVFDSLRGKRVVLLGDSTVEQTFYAIAHAIAGVHRSKLQKNLPRILWRVARMFNDSSLGAAKATAIACGLPRYAFSLGGTQLHYYPLFPARGATLREKGEDEMAQQWPTVDAALSTADVAIANLGLHWTERGPLQLQLGRLAAKLDAFAAAQPSTPRGCRKAAFLLQTTPQHFASSDGSGDFFSRPSLHIWRVKKALHRDPCEPIRSGDAGWRNAALAAVARDFPRLHVLRLHQILAPMYRMHVHLECTHWCWSKELWRPVIDEFARHLTICPRRRGPKLRSLPIGVVETPTRASRR